MQEFNRVIKLNLTTINKIIDVEYEEAVRFEEISEKVVQLLDEEIKEENWYALIAQQNQQLIYEISTIKARWGKLIKKVESKTYKRNSMIIKRKEIRREIIEREKNIINKVEEGVLSKVIEISREKILSDKWIAGESLNETDKGRLTRDIKEILLLKKDEINKVMIEMIDKKKEIEESEIKVTRLTIGVCKIIAKRMIKRNWYHGLVRKWKKTVRKKKDVQLKCITNRRATHSYRGNEYVMEEKAIKKKKKERKKEKEGKRQRE